MQRITHLYDRTTGFLSGRMMESFALLLTRLALASVFWRSGRTKVLEGTALEIDETQYFLFEEFGLPGLSPEIAVPLTTYAEHAFPILLVLGIATRFGAAALLVMTMVIQIFVFPEAWWAVHSLWAAMALVLISRGAGMFSLDAAVTKLRG
ncbi:DoxX family protein [Pontixanthobacter sp.]|uniref:DoxX family protein n=1 Tax=Pontixanthobacter sp. TaxID=2792078 RepID=UPI003C7D7309